MEKFIPYEKLSKKQKRVRDAARRGSWGGLSPVTRRPENPKAYQRKKARIEEELDRVFFMPCPLLRAPAGLRLSLQGRTLRSPARLGCHAQGAAPDRSASGAWPLLSCRREKTMVQYGGEQTRGDDRP